MEVPNGDRSSTPFQNLNESMASGDGFSGFGDPSSFFNLVFPFDNTASHEPYFCTTTKYTLGTLG
jgi:hypothetical protein